MINIRDVVFSIGALLIAVVGHEVAHGYVAYLCGDPTAKSEGRLSLNPLHHIDPIGLLAMVVLKFGWAKAVPINAGYFRNRKRGMIFVSLAGVAFNFLAAFITAFLLVLLVKNRGGVGIGEFLQTVLWYNVMLGVFNLVPLPPLDGSKVLAAFLPREWEITFYRYERYAYILLVAAVFTGMISRWIGPLIYGVINGMMSFWIGVML